MVECGENYGIQLQVNEQVDVTVEVNCLSLGEIFMEFLSNVG